MNPSTLEQPRFGTTRTGHKVFASAIHYLPDRTRTDRFNKALAGRITSWVGSMWCAYLFGLLALVSLPAVLTTAFHLHAFPRWLVDAGLIALVAWIAQTFLQLVLLSVIMVGQQISQDASDARSVKTLEDTMVIMDRVDHRTQGGITEAIRVIQAGFAALGVKPELLAVQDDPDMTQPPPAA